MKMGYMFVRAGFIANHNLTMMIVPVVDITRIYDQVRKINIKREKLVESVSRTLPELEKKKQKDEEEEVDKLQPPYGFLTRIQASVINKYMRLIARP
jgi:actin-related protein